MIKDLCVLAVCAVAFDQSMAVERATIGFAILRMIRDSFTHRTNVMWHMIFMILLITSRSNNTNSGCCIRSRPLPECQ